MTKRRSPSSPAAVARRLKPALYAFAFSTIACVWPSPERQLLLDFFQACRVYDTTVLARMATTACSPATLGVVDGFEMVRVVNEGNRKEVTIDARLHTLAGEGREGPFVVELEDVDGRWLVTNLTPPPASQTSPATSSAPPK
jgi:hypothetical protein